jgi:hypothetical protein
MNATPMPVRQYSPAAVLGVWLAAALPMGILAWIVAPAVAGPDASPSRFAVCLIAALTAGLIWQGVLVLILVAREGNGITRAALLLQPPTDGKGHRGGRLWLWLVPFTVAFAAVVQFFPLDLPSPAAHNFGPFLDSADGRSLLSGNWPLFAVIVTMLTFNTVLGEELLLRGLLLPRMRTAFGRWDWVVNGLLGGLYHLHQPWSIPSSIINHSLFAFASRRWQSTWMGIAIHSAQSVFFLIVMLVLVLS